MTDVLKQSLCRLVLDDNIGHILGYEVMHVLSPELVNAGVIQVPILILRRVGLLNALVVKNLLGEVLVEQLVSIFCLSGPVACLVTPVFAAATA